MNAVTTTLTAERTIADSFEVTRVEANLGAEIRGLDLQRPITSELADLIRALLWEHQVLFFRDTGIDDARQAEIGRIFGPPVADSILKRRGVKDEDIIPFNSGPYSNSYYGTPWHADATYLETPYQVSILRSVIAPEFGGDTAFSSGISAYESLPQDIKHKIDGLSAIHRSTGKAYGMIEDKADLDDYLAEYTVTDQNKNSIDVGEKRIGAPTIIKVVEGKPVSKWQLSDAAIFAAGYPENKYAAWDDATQQGVAASLRDYLAAG